ncbi:putative cytoplasmic dynein 2 heavy chain 1 [Apostichopus japonicus]|uniref:Putative cytoplasmic dynein 2 heavy chain 1 n=1 Tax=Stichopus japonicus TaxID=307972 RepID=A0A2G8JAV8_STIJA|nr:putative cytoplasmic dynein 2 heavy chain 1 [Apostichopus japonicus]
MDSLKFVCKWSGNVPNAKQQIKVGGLQLDGCTFDGSRLSENQRNSPSVCTVPTCNMAWVSQNSDDIYSSTDSISLPVYFSEDREKIVTNLKITLPLLREGSMGPNWGSVILKKSVIISMIVKKHEMLRTEREESRIY